MTDYRSIFAERNVFIAVVHTENHEQAMRNIAIARDNGADGVFLINHSIPASCLIDIYIAAHARFPSFWMGMNMLGQDPTAAIDGMPDNEGGLWVDDAGVQESGESPTADVFLAHRRERPAWKGLYFGGVAFKYQRKVRDPALMAERAMKYVDVITTSGDGTGIPPDVEKIVAMRSRIDGYPLAIASGISPENVAEYTEHADCFLVATGVSDSHTELNPRRVAKLARVIASS